MKKLLLFGAGKSATVLIDFLIQQAEKNQWQILIADTAKEQILLKTGSHPSTEAIEIDITNAAKRRLLVQQADIVISLMPPSLHYLIAEDCILYGKNLLTASYLDEKIKNRQAEIEAKNLLFICEMGLDPGIDHMSAMKLIHEIQEKGGKITSFKSHCGGLVAPESDDNPWHYKISWNPRNVVLAGKAGALYLENDMVVEVPYEQLFKEAKIINVEGLGALAAYPNRDSLSYIPIYGLESANTFERTTFRYPIFCKAWDAIVQSGLTNEDQIENNGKLSFKEWSLPLLPFVTDENAPLLNYLGCFKNDWIPTSLKSSAEILQHLLENSLVMEAQDKDMIVMLHEIEYTLNDQPYYTNSTLIVKGNDHLRTAMAKTVGLPLGIAAQCILNGTIQMKGVQIPTVAEIYEPVLKALVQYDVVFSEKTRPI
ncbi:MAG: saccharopine dehydrogenase C-terminal domain-containing protein [Ferruginibacter sp.]